VHGVSFDVDEGEIVTLIGANGAGKTTVLNTLVRLLPADSGSIVYKGQDLMSMPPHRVVQQGMTLVPEGRRIFGNLTVGENLQLAAFARKDKAQVARDVQRVYDIFPRLYERRAQLGDTLSGGEQQMLAVGRALVTGGEFVLLDEPSMGLAPILVQEIFQILREINERGITILLVEQNARQALKLASRAYVLETGRIVLSGLGGGAGRRSQGSAGLPGRLAAFRHAPDLRRNQSGQSQRQLSRHRGAGGPGAGHANHQGQCLRPRPRAGRPASAERLGAPYLGVALLEEGMRAARERDHHPDSRSRRQHAGAGSPFPRTRPDDHCRFGLEKLAHIEDEARRLGRMARVHLKIDTGMGRLGVQHDNAGEFLEAALRCEQCQVEGIFSHFASADAADLTSAREQLARFQAVLALLRGARPFSPAAAPHGQLRRHLAAAGEPSRPGARRYLCSTASTPRARCRQTVAVRPVLSWKSHAVFVKRLRAGQPVSYGSTWQADHEVRLVTIPAGYGDGYFRALSNRGEVIIGGRRYPIAGRVCMDQIMVNVEQDSVYPGDEVVLLGEAGDEAIGANDLADWAGTIGYEVLTNINSRVPRVYAGGS
jgi:alanine racemase